MKNLLTSLAIASVVLMTGCNKDSMERFNTPSNGKFSQTMVQNVVPLGGSTNFAVLGGETVTNGGESIINGDLGVSPGTAITGFDTDMNTISGPGTVTDGLGIVSGTIYAGGPVAAQAHNDAIIAYDYLMAQVPDVTSGIVYQLDGLTLTPGVYHYASANLLVNGTLTLDFQGNPDALFIFQTESTLVTMAGSKIVAINTGNQTCFSSNIYWAVGSSATIDGAEFIGNVIALTTITMANTENMTGRLWAINGEVTMVATTLSICGDSKVTKVHKPCNDFITGGGWINDKETFGVSGGIKNNKFWGHLSYNNHEGIKVKSTSVTSYLVIDALTRQIEGTAKVNGEGSYTYKVVVTDNGEPGRDDFFSLELLNVDDATYSYSTSGTLVGGGNIQLHIK